MPTQPLQTARRTRRTWLPLVLGALLFAQMLGLVHRIVHAPQVTPVAQATPVHAAKALFGAHDDESTCRLYDQLMHADLAVDTPAFTAALPVAAIETGRHEAWRLAAQAAGFLARGPPSRG
jgi:hypothetical protein